MSGHVLHIITGLGTGGAERSLFNLVTSNLDNRFTHDVVSLAGMGHYGPILLERGISVEAFGMKGAVGLPAALFGVRRVVRRTRPDIVQGWMPHGNVIASMAASMAGRRVGLAWNVRQSLYDLRAEKRATRWMIRGLKAKSARPDAIIYNSNQARAHHEAMGFSARRGIVIPNGFDTERWKPDARCRAALRTKLGIGDDVPLAGFVGRFHALKDVPTFMAACAIAMVENPQLHVVMIGDGLTRNTIALQPHFADLPAQRFFALGPRDDIEAILPGMDFFCLSSVSEAFPNVIGEAMASGLPCVATDVGDCARLLDGNGRIVPRGDAAEMAVAITDLARMSVARRAEIGKAARARIEASYSLRATVAAYMQLYDSMMKREV
ncbi:glycosyltransferase [Sphingopyxis sp. XHP0097]|uniref:Glycosyltransferase n=1 Tax=Sphingopyxis jiangsuensis TaxID=2871171 RepID=A0ABS7MB95_9SPHN|nr:MULTISPECIES: glycosyltransferase [Sphingopyxis]MBL0768207.1 glycosyltransferase [Sphingopyxis lutea]MBY4636078.1 glycosyltransferase [Sphingopyxis jiangsuensis]